MAHRTLKSGYTNLSDRLNRFPQGAPPSELLFSILKILFSEKEAELVSYLPIKPFTAKKASRNWKKGLTDTNKILDKLAGRAILVDIEQKVLSELFYEYLNVEEDFIRELFTRGETQMGRIFVHERASEVIKTATHRGVGLCYCLHKMQHMDRACSAPQEICMTFNNTAASLIRHGNARNVDLQECLDLLQEAYAHNLVQFGENVRTKVNFICNCCACCCEAMTLVSINDPAKPTMKKAKLNEDICLGCGVCVRSCATKGIHLKPRAARVITPLAGVLGVILKLPPFKQVLANRQIKSRYLEALISRR